MEERLATARSGAVTAYLGDVALHSVYDPGTEARRFVGNLKLDPSTRTIFLVAPCLGYLIPPLREAAPRARIVSIQCSSFFSEAVARFPSDAVWTPGGSIGLGAFLEREVTDTETLRSRVVEWRPAALAYGKISVDCVATIHAFIASARANAETVAAFGRRWIRNAFRCLSVVERPCALERGNAPVVVVGSGPSLEDVAGALREAREEGRCAIFAAASALPALFAAGIPVDLAVSSDGGAWARYHLLDASRRGVAVAASLVTALPSSLSAVPTIAIVDHSPWQELLLESAGIPAFRSPQRGTVTATALDLALAATSGTVYLAGLDLAARDLRTHARPYALDRFREDASDRLHPEYSYAFERRGSVSTEKALELYARWFAVRLSGLVDRVAVLGPVHPALAFLPAVERIPESANASGPRLVEYGGGTVGRERSLNAAKALLRTLEAERDALRPAGKPEAREIGACPVPAAGSVGESLLDLTRAPAAGMASEGRDSAEDGYEELISFISKIARNGNHG